MSNPLVSIVTLCWNRKDDILESLNGIFQTEYEPIEVIVVDNGSIDGTIEAIHEQYPKVKLICMPENIGIEAYNYGFKEAKGEYVVILDDDSFPHPKAIERMVKKFARNERLGVVAFDVRNYYSYNEVAKAVVEEKEGQAVAKDYYMGFNGAGAGIRRKLFEEIGYYPAEFFLYWNEQDTAFRVLDKGYQIIFFSDIISYHKYSPKNRNSWRAPYFYTRNAFFLVWKNYPFRMAMKKTLYLIFMSIFSSIEQKNMVYIKAMLAAFFQIGKIKGKRNPVKEDIAKKMRVTLESSFTFFR